MLKKICTVLSKSLVEEFISRCCSYSLSSADCLGRLRVYIYKHVQHWQKFLWRSLSHFIVPTVCQFLNVVVDIRVLTCTVLAKSLVEGLMSRCCSYSLPSHERIGRVPKMCQWLKVL